MIFDGLTLSWRELKLRKNPSCPVCSDQPTQTELIDYEQFCGIGPDDDDSSVDRAGVPQVSATELKGWLEAGDDITLIDVREPHEWDIANLGELGARLIPLDELSRRLAELDSARRIVLHCRSGARSAQALRSLQAAGFRKLWNLDGGILAWAEEVDPSPPAVLTGGGASTATGNEVLPTARRGHITGVLPRLRIRTWPPGGKPAFFGAMKTTLDARGVQPVAPFRPWFLTLFILVVGCGGADGGSLADEEPTTPDRADLRFVVVTHSVAANPFWSVVTNGVGGRRRGAGRSGRLPGRRYVRHGCDEPAHRRGAVASQPHGLVVSIPDEDALGQSIRAAVASGITVISINSGDHFYQCLGVLTHVGQAEYDGGYQGGERLVETGVRKALCVNQEVGNISLDLRCRELTDAVVQAGGSVSVLAVDLADPEDTQQRIRGALVADPSIDGILTLGTTGAEPALRALEEAGRVGAVPLGTFDLSPTVLGRGRRRHALRDRSAAIPTGGTFPSCCTDRRSKRPFRVRHPA